MTVERKAPKLKRSLPGSGERETRRASPGERDPLLSTRAALIIVAALVLGAAAGILAYLAGARPAQAVLTGGGAFGAAVALLNSLIG